MKRAARSRREAVRKTTLVLQGEELVVLSYGDGASSAPSASILEVLTPKQREVAELVREGMSNAEVAGVVGISVGMVRKHLESIYVRLGVRSRAELASLASR